MRKRLIYMVSVGMLVSSFAMTAHSADVKKIKPGDMRQVPQVIQTPQRIDAGNIQRPKPDLKLPEHISQAFFLFYKQPAYNIVLL